MAWAMSHLLAFCRESHFVANTRFLGLFCADFYADIWDLTQILCRYLDKKSAAESSGFRLKTLILTHLRKSEVPPLELILGCIAMTHFFDALCMSLFSQGLRSHGL